MFHQFGIDFFTPLHVCKYISVCMYACMYYACIYGEREQGCVPQQACRGQSKTCRNLFTPSSIMVQSFELRSPDLALAILPSAISLTHVIDFESKNIFLIWKCSLKQDRILMEIFWVTVPRRRYLVTKTFCCNLGLVFHLFEVENNSM